jgi:hypothetical protein
MLWDSGKLDQQYERLGTPEREESLVKKKRTKKDRLLWGACAIILLVLLWSIYATLLRYNFLGVSKQCSSPHVRREWRKLSRHEQLAYLDAVQCTRSLPAVTGLNQTLYDDFPYVHGRVGNYCKPHPLHLSLQLTNKLQRTILQHFSRGIGTCFRFMRLR